MAVATGPRSALDRSWPRRQTGIGNVPGSGDEGRANFYLELKTGEPISHLRSVAVLLDRAFQSRLSMLCTETVTVREPDYHGGKGHGGGDKRSPVIGVLLLVACIYPFRCVVRTSVHSVKRTLLLPFYLPSRLSACHYGSSRNRRF